MSIAYSVKMEAINEQVNDNPFIAALFTVTHLLSLR